ncbi:MAG: NAD(P)H-dependent dehydrogenase/reductase [Deltaproteobacteria bacterium]|nr:MAG: NAD(P)H-dependent dehydrogenase/reductase [Deltaproteobacteria bacterium]
MFIDLIRKRRSTRLFKNREVENEKIEILKESVLRAPSSRSINPWEFIFITDKNILESLSDTKPHGSSFFKTAPLGIVVMADPEKCDVWIEDCSIASIYLQLAGEDIGLKSCWCQIRKRENKKNLTAENFLKKQLNIPDKFRVLSIIAMGYPEKETKGHQADYVTNQLDKIHINKF